MTTNSFQTLIVLFICIISKLDCFGVKLNRTEGAVLISQYARVSHAGNRNEERPQSINFGSSETKINPERSFYSKHLRTGHNEQLYYPAYVNKGYSTIDETENTASVDEIDRYNPRPYFGYGVNNNGAPDPPKNTYGSPSFDDSSLQSDESEKGRPDIGTISYTAPPIESVGPTDSKDSYASALDTLSIPSAINSEPLVKKPPVDSYKPPAAGQPDGGSDFPPDFDGYAYPPNDKPPGSTNTMMGPAMQQTFGMMPEKMPPATADSKPSMMMSDGKLPEYLDYNPDEHGGYHGGGGHHHHHQHDHHPKLVEYVPDYPDHGHHHVYHEVTTTTTTTPAPKMEEHERVNKKPYSYYYLSRKLWYIPLYFSVYFIIYIFALIVKSIIRHKVHFPNEHYWGDFKGSSRSGRQAASTNEVVNTVTETVMGHLQSGVEKYAM